MQFDPIKTVHFLSIVIGFIGLALLSYLQIKLSRRDKKSLMTFISVFFYPKEKLMMHEVQIRKIGGYFILIGPVIAVLCSIIK